MVEQARVIWAHKLVTARAMRTGWAVVRGWRFLLVPFIGIAVGAWAVCRVPDPPGREGRT